MNDKIAKFSKKKVSIDKKMPQSHIITDYPMALQVQTP